ARHRKSIARTPVVALSVVAFAAASCTTPSTRTDPPNAPNAVVSSLDRLRDSQTRLGGPPSCLEDVWCAAGLTRVYGLQLGSGTIAFDTPAATVGALTAGAIDIAALPESAVETADPGVAVLRDDRAVQPADNVVPVVSGKLAAAVGPSLARAVDALSATLDDAGLNGIERALAGGSPSELAAADWLNHHPVLSPTPPPAGAPHIVVGARPDPTGTTLAYIYAGALVRDGWSASVRPVASRLEELAGLERGQLGLTPDFTAELLQVISGYQGTASPDQFRNLVLLRSGLADLGIVAYEPAPAKHSTVFAVSRAVASTWSLATLSDLARVSGSHPPFATPPAPLTRAERATDNEGPLHSLPVTLGVGSSGPAVETVQTRLIALGYTNVTATGAFDEATRRAVAALQADVGLITDGAVDPATARALRAAKPGVHAAGRPAPAPGDPNTLRPPSEVGGSAPRAIYLMFADGPSDYTAEITSVLARFGAKATFFAENGAVASEPETLREVMAAGDAVGISMWPHNAVSAIAQDALARTASATQIAVSSVDGVTPTCVLAPYGSTDAASRQRAASLGLRVALWDLDPQDWRLPGAAAIASDVINSARPGSMVLLHDGGGDRTQTVAALNEIVATLTQLGYTFAAIPGC
ncbi:MAG TPA: polysaccharide deacetylase family protein, partial [Acidimicrobiia bacterium]|nr:polysaccharide deacetylase family protein [Acidimicrobiia bacterium]